MKTFTYICCSSTIIGGPSYTNEGKFYQIYCPYCRKFYNENKSNKG